MNEPTPITAQQRLANCNLTIRQGEAIKFFSNLILNDLQKEGIYCWIAGGALRDFFSNQRPFKDIDIFFKSSDDQQKAKKFFLNRSASLVFEGANGIKLKYEGIDYDLISIYAENPTATISLFDFTVVMFAVDFQSLYSYPTSFMDLAMKSLRINTINSAAKTFQRVLKFTQQGFTLPVTEHLSLIKSLQGCDTSGIEIRDDTSGEAEFYRDQITFITTGSRL